VSELGSGEQRGKQREICAGPRPWAARQCGSVRACLTRVVLRRARRRRARLAAGRAQRARRALSRSPLFAPFLPAPRSSAAVGRAGGGCRCVRARVACARRRPGRFVHRFFGARFGAVACRRRSLRAAPTAAARAPTPPGDPAASAPPRIRPPTAHCACA